MVFRNWPQAPGDGGFVGIGMILVPEGTGSTVLWSPITDGDAPWFWVDYFFIGYEEMVIDTIGQPFWSGARRVIDSKAMRIVKNMEIQAVLENVTAGGTIDVVAAVQARFLAGT